MGLKFDIEPPGAPVWMDVGAPPAALTEDFQRRRRIAGRVIPLSAGVITGVVAGFLASLVAADLNGGPFVLNIELSVAVGLPVGVAVFFFQRWLISRIVRRADLPVRRVAVSGGNLLVEMDSGGSMTWPLPRVNVSPNKSEGGWYGVWVTEGSTVQSFYAPPAVADAIRTASGHSLA